MSQAVNGIGAHHTNAVNGRTIFSPAYLTESFFFLHFIYVATENDLRDDPFKLLFLIISQTNFKYVLNGSN